MRLPLRWWGKTSAYGSSLPSTREDQGGGLLGLPESMAGEMGLHTSHPTTCTCVRALSRSRSAPVRGMQ